MKRLCFYCFWITDHSRLIRRYLAKEYYALSDDNLLSIPFFVNDTHISSTEVSSIGKLQRDRKITLNDLAPEILVKERALEIYGNPERIQRARNLKYDECQRLHWEV